MRLVNREVEPYWWCIRSECKYWRGNSNVRSYDRCKHSDVAGLTKNYTHETVGLWIKRLPMCPVLADIRLEDINSK